MFTVRATAGRPYVVRQLHGVPWPHGEHGLLGIAVMPDLFGPLARDEREELGEVAAALLDLLDLQEDLVAQGPDLEAEVAEQS